MEKSELRYGFFEKSKPKSELETKIDNDRELSQNESERAFQKQIDEISGFFEQNGESENDTISVVAEIDDEEKVTVALSEDETEENSTGKKIRFRTIGKNLIAIISSLVIISLGSITVLVSYYVTKDTRANAEYSNLTINQRAAGDVDNNLKTIVSEVSLFCDLCMDEEKSEEQYEVEVKKFFDRNRDIGSIAFADDKKIFFSKAFFASRDIKSETAEAYFNSEEQSVKKAQGGTVCVKNASPFFGTPVLAIFFNVRTSLKIRTVMALVSSEGLIESVSTGKINETYLMNPDGIILIHSDNDLMMNAADFSGRKYVREIISGKSGNMQQNYFDEDNKEYYAACKKISVGNCYVVTQVKAATILEAINATTRRNIALSIAILSIAILIIWIYSKTLTIPLGKLTKVTDEINRGNFNTDLFNSLNEKRRDEIGVLNRSTKAERDILNTVARLTNKGVTRAVVRKEIDFNPHLKDITIFFSDIRGFTAISDGFNKRFGEKSAAEIIGFLNDYMSRMVNCISITGGVVDKFEGDAVMAAWGVLRDDNLDYENEAVLDEDQEAQKKNHERHVREDALSAIRSTLAMRYALMKYNKDAEAYNELHKNEENAKYKPHIRIGCGLNSGRATVGFMGSNEKMEFTSIGDAVNLASRTESSNKPCGTDILITEDTYNLLKMEYIKCQENKWTIKSENQKNEIMVEQIPVTFEVKGKGAQHFYGVVNMPHFDIEGFFKTSNPDFVSDKDCIKACGHEGPQSLAEVRKLLGIPTPDFGGVNLDEEENKVKVQ